jgi:hypothetical protein
MMLWQAPREVAVQIKPKAAKGRIPFELRFEEHKGTGYAQVYTPRATCALSGFLFLTCVR